MSLPLIHAGRTNPGLSAALDLRFALDKSLTAYRGPTPSFSRASTGTFFNSSGVLTTAAVNAPRFNHTYNGTSWVSRGLLVEEQRTNSLINSNNISGTGWVRSNGSLISNSQTSPDGTLNASEYVGNNGASYFEFYQQLSLVSGIYTNSIFLKSSNTGADIVSMWGYAGNAAVGWFNLANGTSQSGTELGISYTATIKNCGNGWFCCSITNNTATTCSYIFPCRPMTAMGGTTSLSGNGVRSVYVYGAQLESGSFPTSYIPTTTAAVTRSADVCQITGSDFSGFWNASEGSFAVEYDRLANHNAGNTGRWTLNFTNGSTSNIDNFAATPGLGVFNDYCSIYRTGAQQAAVFVSSLAGGVMAKSAAGWKINDFAASFNGGAVQTDNSVDVPVDINRLNIGMENSAYFLCGHISRLRYFNKRLSNTNLQKLSDPDPTLNLQFALNKTLTPVAGPAPSFSRASTGTFFNASGVLTNASINTPRFDHTFSGGQWVSRGLLIEEQRTNLCTHSEDITNSSWNKYNSVSILANNATAPNGTLTADRLYPTVSGVNLLEKVISGLTSGATYSYSYYAKSAGFQWIRGVEIAGSASFWVDVVNGVVGTKQTSSVGAFTVSIAPAGNGWFKISVTSVTNSTSQYIYTSPVDANANTISTPSGTNGILYWGFQFESGAFPTSYTPTTTAAVTRSADVCQITGTDFSGFYNGSEGSFVTEADSIGFATTGLDRYIVTFNSSGIAYLGYGIFPSTGLTYDVYNTTIQARLSYTQPNAGDSFKLASCYKANDFAATLNGSAVQTDTSGTVPTATNVGIGYYPGYNQYGNCHIAKLIYYPARLTNANLRFLTGGSKAFQPDNINGLQFWVDAADSTTLYQDSALTTRAINDGDPIGGWRDKSGNNRHALQATTGYRPTVKSNFLNGRSAISFGATRQELSTSTGWTIGLYTAFVVRKFNTLLSSRFLYAAGNSGGNLQSIMQGYSVLETEFIQVGSSPYLELKSGISSTAWGQVTNQQATLSGLTRLKFRQNGADITGTFVGTLDPTVPQSFPLTLGGLGYSFNTPLDGYISEFLIYDSVLSAENVALVESYLKTKWGTP